MSKICYVPKDFKKSSQDLIDSANTIIAEYVEQGFDLTVRQLFYQMVSRAIIENTVQSYKRLGSIINDARLAGQIDWDRITDLTRELRGLPHWSTPGDIINSAAASYHVDKWAEQEHRVEIWVEKDALRNVVERICNELDVSFFVCRGYTSQSEMHVADMRLIRFNRVRQSPIIFHLGDHDPSGVDMTRDIRDRLELFGADFKIRRIALNMDQVEQYNPPPNPAKETDSRCTGYKDLYGDSSWELDALDPRTLSDLIREHVEAVRDEDLWNDAIRREEHDRELLELAASRWDDVKQFLEDGDTGDGDEPEPTSPPEPPAPKKPSATARKKVVKAKDKSKRGRTK